MPSATGAARPPDGRERHTARRSRYQMLPRNPIRRGASGVLVGERLRAIAAAVDSAHNSRGRTQVIPSLDPHRAARRLAGSLGVGTMLLLSSLTAAPSGAQGAAPKGYVGLFGDNAVAVFDTTANRVLT